MHGDLPAPDTSTSRRVTRNLLEFPPARCWIEQRYDVLRNRAPDMASEADAETRVITWLLSVALNRSILAKLAGRLGLEFPGTRLAAVPPDVIADALIERWEEPDVRRAIITTLTRSLPDERARVAQAGTDEIALQAMAREVIQDPNARRLDGLIWALVQSPHDIARALAMVLMQSIEQSVLKHEVSSAYALVEDLESARDEVSTNLKEARQALRRILTQAGGVDAIVLASGDGDFLPLLTYCRRHRIRTEVLAFPGSGSAALAMVADSYQELGPHVLWDASEVPGIPAR